MRANAHSHVPVEELRRALRVEGDEISLRARLARDVVAATDHVIEEALGELAAAIRAVRTADPRSRQRTAHGIHRVVVQLVEVFVRAVPVGWPIRFVPYLPVPFLDLG